MYICASRQNNCRIITSLRNGGVSEFPFQSLNTAFHVGDRDSSVKENRRLLFEEVSMPLRNAVYMEQTHSTNVKIVSNIHIGRGAFGEGAIGNTDALITKEKLLPIAVQTADCLPVVIHDEKTPSIAVIHCGWRGLTAGIIENTVALMKEAFNTRAENCFSFLSASIDVYNYEIGEDTAKFFLFPVRKDGRVYGDLKFEARSRLKTLGFEEENIEVSTLSTYTEEDKFYSYRRDKHTGRMSTVAMLE